MGHGMVCPPVHGDGSEIGDTRILEVTHGVGLKSEKQFFCTLCNPPKVSQTNGLTAPAAIAYPSCVTHQAFSRQDKVTRHIKSVHEQRKDRVCPLCSKAFSRQDKLTAHMKSVHGSKHSHPACAFCNELYDETIRLIQQGMPMDEAHQKASFSARSHQGRSLNSNSYLSGNAADKD